MKNNKKMFMVSSYYIFARYCESNSQNMSV
jgi:hypothetical protein